jgi:hypothetical protein
VDGDKPLEFEDQIALPSGTQWFLSLYSTVKNLEGEIQGVALCEAKVPRR